MTPRSCVLAPLLAPLWFGLAGCPAFDDDDSAAAGAAPLIEASSPSAAVQVLPRDGAIEFSARGRDDDSLDLNFQFTLDGAYSAGGDTDDGQFDASWTLTWEAALAGSSAEVAFVVTDGSSATERRWALDVDP